MIFKILILINSIYYFFLVIKVKNSEIKAQKALRLFFKQRADQKQHLSDETYNRLQAKFELLQKCYKRYIISVLIYIALLLIVFIIGVIAFFKFKINYQVIIDMFYIPFCVLAIIIVVCSAIDLLITTRKTKSEKQGGF